MRRIPTPSRIACARLAAAHLISLATLGLLLAGGPAAVAKTCNWTNGSRADADPGNDSDEWSVDLNWDCTGVPGAGDTAVVESDPFGGSTGTQVIVASPTSVQDLTLADSFDKLILDANLTVTGGVNWFVGTIDLGLGDLINQGVLDAKGDLLMDTAVGGDGSFVNSGTLLKSGGAGTLQLDVPLDNQGGTMNCDSGTMTFFRGGAIDGGTLTASLGNQLVLTEVPNGPGYELAGTIAGSPAGSVRMKASMTVPSGTATLNLGGTGLQWEEGTLGGAGQLTNSGYLQLTVNLDKGLTTTLTNVGTIDWLAGNLNVDGGAIVNEGQMDAQSDAIIDTVGSGGSFTNRGDFVKSANPAGGFFPTDLDVDVTNEAGGTFGSDVGLLRFTRAFDHQPGGTIRGDGGIVSVQLAAPFMHDGVTAPGASAGVLTWWGDWTPSASAELAVELGGLLAGSEHDQLVLPAPFSATLGGTLKITLVGGFVPMLGQEFTIITCGGTCSGAFAVVDEPAGYDFSVVVSSDEVKLVVTDEPCMAPDGENLTLSDDTVLGTRVYEVCEVITVGPNFAVMGPNGDLTLRGKLVQLGDDTSVLIDGELTIENLP